jgi:O-antigen ligase
MANNLISLIIILSISSLTYLYLSQAIKPVVGVNNFKVWILLWVGLTTVSFLAFHVLLLFVLSALLILWASKKVDNKVALYFMVSFAIQEYSIQTPILNISYQTVLGLTLLLPLFIGILAERNTYKSAKSNADIFLKLYLILIFILTFRGLHTESMHGYTLTYPQLVKIAATYFLQYFLPYYVVSRYVKKLEQIKTIVFALTSLCIILAPLALYEIVTSNSLYASIPYNLNLSGFVPSVIQRAGMLRATVSIDHPLYLGLLLMIGLSLFAFSANYIKSKFLVFLGFLILLLGFIAPLSKGPWSGALISFVLLYLLSPNKLKKGSIILGCLTIILILLFNSSYAETVVSLLPFIGDADSGTTEYRGLFFKQSLIIIDQYPVFGMYEPRTHKAMLPLFQGEGLVDLINVYVSIALRYGLLALSLYLLFICTVVFTLIKELILIKDKRTYTFKCGASLLSSFIALLIVMVSIADATITSTLLLSLSGLIVSYTNILKNQRRETQDSLTSFKTSRPASQE